MHISLTDWNILSQKRIFFGHQSVGQNIVMGIKEIVPYVVNLHIGVIYKPSDYGDPVFGHKEIGENTKPISKIDDFVRLMDSGIGDKVDIAMMKLCFIDFKEDTDVQHLFNEYKKALSYLKNKYPNVTFVHITTPLATGRWGIINAIKYLLGTPTLNQKRKEYNDMLIAEYKNIDPIYDLAKVETGGSSRYALSLDYTDDGGHLNDLGRRVVSQSFAAFLISIPAKKT